MNIADIPKYFSTLERPARIRVFRKKNVVVIKTEAQHLEEAVNRFERSRPTFMKFIYRPLNPWDRFLLRKQKIRMELK